MRIFFSLLILCSTCFGQYAPAPTSAAASLTGTTLASNVTAASLTSLGTVTTLLVGGNSGFGTTVISPGYGSGNGSLTIQNSKSLAFNNASNFWDTTFAGAAVTYFSDNNLYIDAKELASSIIFRVSGTTERFRINSTGASGDGSQLINLPSQLYSGSFSGVGTATASFVVTIGTTQANSTYKVSVEPTNLLAAAVQYVSAKTTTTFTVTYLAGLTGTVTFDWGVFP